MNWNEKHIKPKQSDKTQQNVLDHSPIPIQVRFFGFLGFMLGGLLTFYLGGYLFDIKLSEWEIGDWNEKTLMFFLAVFGIAFVGRKIGLAIGMRIKIGNQQGRFVMVILWNYSTYSFIIWHLLLVAVFTKVYGQEAIDFVSGVNRWYFIATTVGISVGGGLLISFLLRSFGLLTNPTNQRVSSSILVALFVTMAMAYLQFILLEIDTHDWIIMGVVHAVALVKLASDAIFRDTN